MADSFEEHFTFAHPITTDIGRRQRVAFWFSLIAAEIGERKARALVKSEISGPARRHPVYFQYLALLERYDAMPEPSAKTLARTIAHERWKRPSQDQIEQVRGGIRRAIA